MSKLFKAMTIAGSDAGGGAGIQADLKTFAALGVYGTSAITALTAQNTVGVQGVYPAPAEFVGQQIDSIMSDIGADAAKTGMLFDAAIIETVADRVHKYGIEMLVVDPVMVAKSGAVLLQPQAIEALRDRLAPLAYIITPNIPEAGELAAMSLDGDNLEQVREAARRIGALGVRHVLIKGGHRHGSALDLLYDGNQFTTFDTPRLQTHNTHGTGCTLSSAIAAYLAQGYGVIAAVEQAKQYLTEAMQAAVAIGAGFSPVNHFYQVYRFQS